MLDPSLVNFISAQNLTKVFIENLILFKKSLSAMTLLPDMSNNTKSYIDAHCHLASPEFKDDLKIVLERSKDVGLKACVVVSEFLTEFDQVLKICQLNPGFLYACVGIHPVQSQMTSVTLKEVEDALPLINKYSTHLVGIGEVRLGCFNSSTNNNESNAS